MHSYLSTHTDTPKFPGLRSILIGLTGLFTAAALYGQGSLTPPSGSPAPEMKSLQEIWDKIEALEQVNATQTQEIAALRAQNSALLKETGGAPWQISEAISNGTDVSTAKKPDGTIAIAYTREDDLWYAELTGGTWQAVEVDNNSELFNAPSLAISPSGNPGISYQDGTNGDLKYAGYDGTQWTTEYVETSDDSLGLYSSLAFSPSGYPSITYSDATNRRLRYAFFSDGIDFQLWLTSELDSGTLVFGQVSHAYDGQGNPIVAYQDGDNRNLKYAVNQGGSWQYIAVDAQAADTGTNPSLAITPDGKPAIAYYEATTNSLKYAQQFNSSWSTYVVDSNLEQMQPIHLSFRPNGEPSISHQTFTFPRELYYTEYYQGEWRTDSVVNLSPLGNTSDMVIDDTGEPIIFYSPGVGTFPINMARRTTSGE